MIVIGVIGLCFVVILWILLYLYFVRRADRFMDAWEKRMKEKAQETTQQSLKSLEEATRAFEASLSGIESIQEAVQEITRSRKALEEAAFQKGFIPALTSETRPPKPTPLPSPQPTPTLNYAVDFAECEKPRRKGWENWERGPLIPCPSY